MMALKRVAVLLICACVVTGEVDPKFTDFIGDWTQMDTPHNETADSPQHSTDRQLEGRLYESVYYNSYEKAIEISKDIVKQSRSHIIKSTVDFMIEHKKSFTSAFAYKLWEANGRAIVEETFPEEFKMVFNDSTITLTNYWYNEPIMLDDRIDLQKDRYVITNHRTALDREYKWKLEPAYEGNKIYFKIRHLSDGRYVKQAEGSDWDGDYLTYASPGSDTRRHLWSFQPVRHDGIILFFIINREHQEALNPTKTIYARDRRVIGARGDFASNPARYGWRVQFVTDDV